MKRFGLGLLACLMLAGCDPHTEETTRAYQLPSELAERGCKIYRIEGEANYATVRVVYCPNAQTTTTYKAGKSMQSTSVIAE